MRTYKHFFKQITITALLVAGITTTGVAQDTTSIDTPEADTPVILTTSPTGGEMNVDLGDAMEITFSSDMDETTINGTSLLLQATHTDSVNKMPGEMRDNQIRDRLPITESGNKMEYTKSAVSGTISYSNKVALFTPTNELKEGTHYTFTVTNDVKNSENIALKNDHSWSFTTTGTSGVTYSDNQNGNSDEKKNEAGYSTPDSMFVDSPSMIDLGKAGMYVILAKEAVNNEADSRITGLIGEGSSSNSTDKESDSIHSAMQSNSDKIFILQSNQSDTSSTNINQAIEDMMSAYGDASMQDGDSLTSHKNEHFHNTVLTSGVYEWSDSLHIESDVTLSGSADDVWLFKIGENLSVDENIVFTLTNGAQTENIIWYVEGDVTIGKEAHFEGVILSMNEIMLEKGAKLNGRMFSQTSITLNDNTVTEPGRMAGQTSSTYR